MTIRLYVNEEQQRSGAPLLARLIEDRFASRLFREDRTLWGPEAEVDASNRLGWVDPYAESERVLAEAIRLRTQLARTGIDRVVLCGMGGSSLGPEVMAREAGVTLHVVDSTHPEVVRRALDCDLARTAVVISSKSGDTLETITHSELFQSAFLAAGLDPTAHLIYVTDPGSPLDSLENEGYRVFRADPQVGGRFSALTAFGIVPTVLAGADTAKLLDQAREASALLGIDSAENPALRLAAALAGGLPERYVLLLSEAENARWGLGDWIEQLIAESTGKSGRGVLPIALDRGSHELYAPPVNSVRLGIGVDSGTTFEFEVDAPLGAQLLFWQVVTVALGRLIGINPFDQPDVEAAKAAAHALIGQNSDSGTEEAALDEDTLIARLRDALPANGYVAIQAYVDPTSSRGADARRLRDRLAEELGAPVALGWGPRYLHSTGQLHKGGPGLGVYVQLLDTRAAELPIPRTRNGVAALLRAQARGDRSVLEARGRTVLTCAE